jgi:hypothetical protein
MSTTSVRSALLAAIAVAALNASPAHAVEDAGPKTPEALETITDWLKQCMDQCGADERCKKALCASTWAHYVACDRENGIACRERDRDRLLIDLFNDLKKSATVAQPSTITSPLPIQCLQDTAAELISKCAATNCDKTRLPNAIRAAQQIMCGYSGVQPSR